MIEQHGGVLGRILADGADVGTGAAAFNGRYAALFDGGYLAFGLAVCTVSVAYFGGFVAQTMAWIGTGGGIRRIWFYRIVYAGFAADSCFKGDGVGHVQSCVDDVFCGFVVWREAQRQDCVGHVIGSGRLDMGGYAWRDCGIFVGRRHRVGRSAGVLQPLLLGYLYDDRQGGVAGD